MKIQLIPAFLLLLLGTACTVYREYPIEVFNPGDIFIPPSAKNAAIIYRNFRFTNDTLMHYYKNDYRLVRAKNDPAGLDSLLVTACMNELATHMKYNNAFDELHIFPYHTFDKHSGEHLTDLPPEIIEQITTASGAELLISLETFSSFFSSYPQTLDSPATNEVITVAVWSVYDPVRDVRIERKSMIDTVYWNGYDEEGNFQQGYRPPPRLTALELAAALAGENYSKRFYATWQEVIRVYSVPPLPDFSEAAGYFEEGKLDEAIALWQRYADERNGKMAINARFNLALAFEMKDDPDSALRWLNAAQILANKYRSKNDLRMIAAYKQVLETRRAAIRKLHHSEKEPTGS